MLHNALVLELVYSLVSETRGHRPCGFKSHRGHQKCLNRIEKFVKIEYNATVVELAYTRVSEARPAKVEGSNPSRRTK